MIPMNTRHQCVLIKCPTDTKQQNIMLLYITALQTDKTYIPSQTYHLESALIQLAVGCEVGDVDVGGKWDELAVGFEVGVVDCERK